MNSIKSFFSKVKSGGSLKYIIPSMIAVVLIAIVIGNYLRPDRALGSVYSIEQANQDISRIKVGDTISYDINGYSDWEVLYVDKENGRVDVVSKTPAGEITVSGQTSPEQYESLVSEKISQFAVGNYAVAARTLSREEFGMVAIDDDFWMPESDEYNFKTAKGQYTYNYYNPDPYALPYIAINVSTYDRDNYNAGDTYNYSLNGIDEWIIMEIQNTRFYLIPKNPIKINFDPNLEIYDQVREIVDSFNTNGVYTYGSAINRYDTSQIVAGLKDFFKNVGRDVFIMETNSRQSVIRDYGDREQYYADGCNGKYYSRDGYISRCYGFYHDYAKEKTLGVRPVVTLELNKKKVDKELNSGIKVGDHVKYEANDYSNWRVLSINDDGTVDLVSGGIVKNITMTGTDDYHNYTDTLQREVDAYKNGANVVSARPLGKEDISKLTTIKDNVNVKYWINSKKNDKEDFGGYQFDVFATTVGRFNGESIVLNSIYLYLSGDEWSAYYTGFKVGSNSYTAGLRPVIRVKVDGLRKLTSSETEKVEKSSSAVDKSFDKSQSISNKGYTYVVKDYNPEGSSKGPGVVSSDGTGKGNGEGDVNYITNNSSAIGKGYLRFIVIALSGIFLAGVSIAVLLGLIYKKLDKLR